MDDTKPFTYHRIGDDSVIQEDSMIKVSTSNVNLGNESDGLLMPSRVINQSNISSLNNGYRPSDQGHPSITS